MANSLSQLRRLPRARSRGLSRVQPRGRRAFTLIEMITVIGIVLILVGLFLGGMKKWYSASAKQVTLSRMEMLNGMLSELEASGHNSFAAQPFMLTTGTPLDASKFCNIAAENFPNYLTNTLSTESLTVGTTATVIGTNDRAGAINYVSSSVYVAAPGAIGTPGGTPGIMALLAAMPNNAKGLASLPSTETEVNLLPTLAPPQQQGPPVVLDGWNNPIIFVPAAGLINVYGNLQSNTSPPTGTLIAPLANPLRSPDGRPFWVSAGPDGDLIRGDDNIYSFDAH